MPAPPPPLLLLLLLPVMRDAPPVALGEPGPFFHLCRERIATKAHTLHAPAPMLLFLATRVGPSRLHQVEVRVLELPGPAGDRPHRVSLVP